MRDVYSSFIISNYSSQKKFRLASSNDYNSNPLSSPIIVVVIVIPVNKRYYTRYLFNFRFLGIKSINSSIIILIKLRITSVRFARSS